MKVNAYTQRGNEKVYLDRKNIVHILQHVKRKYDLIPKEFVEIAKRSVRVTTEGKCEFSYGVNHDVNTTEEYDDEDDDTEGEDYGVTFGTPHVSRRHSWSSASSNV